LEKAGFPLFSFMMRQQCNQDIFTLKEVSHYLVENKNMMWSASMCVVDAADNVHLKYHAWTFGSLF
jgi:hypothetical protein